ncbi:MAG: PKD domain-containing protein [Dehalococcoidia bacterium]|nr:PKD domain-containing protein [Dehalococcoidia bacterium]
MKTGPKFIAVLSILLFLLSCMFASCSNQSAQQSSQLSIQSLASVQSQTTPGGSVLIESKVSNPDNANLNYKWSATGGGFGGSGASNTWQAPSQEGSYEITLTVEDGEGSTAQAKTTVTVSNNRPPAITGLSAEPVNVLPGGSTNIKCAASDPDGDILNYSWHASDGTVSGTGNKVSWVSPNKSGDFNITCVVSDGKGGEARRVIAVEVSPSRSNISISLIKEESGTVSSTGDKDITRYRAGDDAANIVYRAFFSYDIFSLNNTKIKQAKLKFGPGKTNGDPFGTLTGIRLWKVGYGNGLPDYNITGDNLYHAGALFTSAPTEVDITPEITALVAAGADKFQFEALFYKNTNDNNSIDYIEWPEVSLLVTFNP